MATRAPSELINLLCSHWAALGDSRNSPPPSSCYHLLTIVPLTLKVYHLRPVSTIPWKYRSPRPKVSRNRSNDTTPWIRQEFPFIQDWTGQKISLKSVLKQEKQQNSKFGKQIGLSVKVKTKSENRKWKWKGRSHRQMELTVKVKKLNYNWKWKKSLDWEGRWCWLWKWKRKHLSEN